MKSTLVNPTDEELLRQMLAGDADAFATLYDRRQGAIYRFSLRMSDSETIAEDVTQDVFIALMRDGNQFDPQRGTVASYLYGIARYRVLQKLAKERSFVSLTDESADVEAPLLESLVANENPLSDLSRSETIDAVRQAIMALPAHYREVVVLCNLHELNYQQAADVIGCAIGTVRSRLHRARLMLQEKLRVLDTVDYESRRVTVGKDADTNLNGLTCARVVI